LGGRSGPATWRSAICAARLCQSNGRGKKDRLDPSKEPVGGHMSRRIRSARPTEGVEQPRTGLDVESFTPLVPLFTESGLEMPLAIPSVAGGPLPRSVDPYSPDSFATPARKSIRSLGWLSPRRRKIANPLLAPSTDTEGVSITLSEQSRLFSSRKIKDIWKLFYILRAIFPRPDESNQEVRNLCMEWKRKFDGGSPRTLPRFFKNCPEIAVWAFWVERALHEIQIRSTKNKSPQFDLLRECVRILTDAQLARLTGR
jgi:hypothetical protein